MRSDFAVTGSGLTYEIRNIAEIANYLASLGMEISFENTGDPVAKGEVIPTWMKDVIKEVIDDDKSFAYSPTRGIESTRKYLADVNNKRGGAQISKDDILFFNGLGDAIARCYSSMRVDARVIMPEPTYSTHFMAEVMHSSFPPNTYRLDPHNNWEPDIDDLERKVKSHKSIVGILVVNPDNPTGHVYSEENLRKIVAIAEKYDLFLMFDELYHNMIYNGYTTPYLSDIIGDTVQGMSMKSLSKEVPWPGGRCGWIEVYNSGKDPDFDRYINMIFQLKMAEVCSTTIPQMAIPKILEHKEYQSYLVERVKYYEKVATLAYDILKDVPYVKVSKPNGAFYITVVFDEPLMNVRQFLEIKDPKIREFIDSKLNVSAENDKRFTYNLLGSTGICLVPLTSFFSPMQGFRVVLLEKDIKIFEKNLRIIAKKVVEYIESSK